MGVEGAIARQHRIEKDVAANGPDVETPGLDRGDVEVAASSLRGETTGGSVNDLIATRGLKREFPPGADRPDFTRHGTERDFTSDVLDPNIARGGVDPNPAGDRPGNLDGNVGPGMATASAARLAHLGRGPGSATPERPRDLTDDCIEVDVSRDADPSASGARVHADLDLVMVSVDVEIDLLVTEISTITGCDMTNEHVGPLGSSDGHGAIRVVDFQHDRLIEVNGDTVLAPIFRVSTVRHDSSSQCWWVPVQGARTAVAEPPATQR